MSTEAFSFAAPESAPAFPVAQPPPPHAESFLFVPPEGAPAFPVAQPQPQPQSRADPPPPHAESFSFAPPEGSPAFPVAQPQAQPQSRVNPAPPRAENSLEYWRRRAEVLDPVVFELRKQIKSYREQIAILDPARAARIDEWKEKYGEVKANYDQLFKEDKQRAQAHAAAASEWEANIQKLTEEKLALEGKSDQWNESKQTLTGEKLALEQKVADMAASSKEEDSKRIKLQMQIDELVKQNDQQAATISGLEADVEEKRGQVTKLSAEVKRKERDIQDRDHMCNDANEKHRKAEEKHRDMCNRLDKKARELTDAKNTAQTEAKQLRSDLDLSYNQKVRLEVDKKTCEQALKDCTNRLIEQDRTLQECSGALKELAGTKALVERLQAELADLDYENTRRRPQPEETRGRARISLDHELSSADGKSERSVSGERVESSVEDSTLSSDTDRTLSPSRLDSGVESTIRTTTKAPKPITGFFSVRNRDFRMHKPERNSIDVLLSDSDLGESSRLASNCSRGAPADGEAAVSPASVGTPETEPDSRNAAVASTATALPSTLLASDELSAIKNQKPITEDRLTIEPSSKDSPLIDTSPRVTTQSHVKEAKEEEDVTASEKSSSFRSNEDQKVKDAGDIIEEKPTGHNTSEFTVEHPPTPQGLDMPATVIETECAQEATASGKSGSFRSNEDQKVKEAGVIIEAKPTGHTASECTVGHPPTPQGRDVLATVIEPGRAHRAGAGGIAAPSIAISKSKTFSHNPFRCWLQVYVDLWTCFMGWLAFHNSSLVADTGLNGPHPRTKYLQINPTAPLSGENARAYRDQAPPKIELPPFWTNVFWLLTHIAIYAFFYICASNYSRTLRERASWQAANELTRQMFLRDYGYLHRHFGEQNWLDIICFNLSTWLDVGPSYSG